MATNCEFCGYKDNEVKSGAAISEQGKRITIRCEDREDLSRDILKASEYQWAQYTYTDRWVKRVKRQG